MRFGDTDIKDAEGAVLAHGVHAGGRRIRKGTKLTGEHIAHLKEAGVARVVAVRLEAGDIDEDSAADTLARATMPDGVRLTRAATGRVNVHATRRGIVRFERDRLKGVNMVDEGITLACVQHNQLVEAGDMIATLKIIPYAVPKTAVDAVGAHVKKAPVLTFHQLAPLPVALVQTRVDGMKESVLASTEKVTKKRIDQLGCSLVDSRVVAHDSAAVAGAIAGARALGARMVLVCGASAISDRRDVVPQAVVEAGGKLLRLGLPVDPGNLLMLARIDDVHVIGMPGCARSARLNGFDWVLHLVLAGIEPTHDEMADMAIGGLLMEIESRPLPRRLVEAPAGGRGRVGGILLAAGKSSRMGGRNKLLIEMNGVAMVRRAAMAMIDGGVHDLVVVTGHEADAVAAALDGLDLRIVENPDFASGQASSVAAGVAGLGEGLDGVLVGLGDMPHIAAGLVAEMIRDHQSLGAPAARVSFPSFAGRRGNPVLWGASFFGELCHLKGDTGARGLLEEHRDAVNIIGWGDDSIHRDIDSPRDLDAAE